MLRLRMEGRLPLDGPGSVIYVQNLACGFSNKVRDVGGSPLILLDLGK